MKRIHAFEFEDLPWFPVRLRNYATDFLQFGANTFNIYKNVLPVIRKGIAASGNNRIIDVASGGGGGLITLAHQLVKDEPKLKITLTDYYPNLRSFKRTREALPGVFEFVETPVNALDVPATLTGFRTQFLSLHHFKPADAKAILQNAVDRRQGIGIFEAQQRNLKSLVPMILSPLTVLLTTPFIRPFSLGRIFFTYLIPVVPLFVLWDGIISVLRTYTVEELKQFVSELRDTDRFEWEIAVVRSGPGEVLYLLGLPKKS